jgi:hypothetical protein
MTDVIVPFTGWGRGTWGQLAFGEGSVTNAGATGVIGSVTVVAEANIPVTGLRVQRLLDPFLFKQQQT